MIIEIHKDSMVQHYLLSLNNWKNNINKVSESDVLYYKERIKETIKKLNNIDVRIMKHYDKLIEQVLFNKNELVLFDTFNYESCEQGGNTTRTRVFLFGLYSKDCSYNY